MFLHTLLLFNPKMSQPRNSCVRPKPVRCCRRGQEAVLAQVNQGHQDLRHWIEFECRTCANGSFAFSNVQPFDFGFVPEGFKRFYDGVELVGCDSSQTLERCGSFLELSGGEHDLILLVLTL